MELKLGGGIRTIDLVAVPLFSKKNHCLVLFDDTTFKKPPVQAGNTGAPVTARRKNKQTDFERDNASLTRELAETKRDLQAIIQEQESTNEELQVANEEILSSNEELQSTNEELQTAKEELQATNEELTTVNEEMQNRNAELTHAIDDLRNLTASLEVGIVMLESDLTVRYFTPAVGKVLNLIAGDIGRPIGNINPNIKVSPLDELIPQSIDKLTATEQEVQDLKGRWYSVRIRPYRTQDNKIDGAVLILVDIDKLKRTEETYRRTEEKLTASQSRFRALFEHSGIGMALVSVDGRDLESNPALQKMFGYSAKELSGMVFTEFTHPEDADADMQLYKELITGKRESYQMEKRYYRKDGALVWTNLTVSLVREEGGAPIYAIRMVQDISRHKQAEQSPRTKEADA